jgi:hypothetical protein
MKRASCFLAVTLALGGCDVAADELDGSSSALKLRPDEELWETQSAPLLGTLDPGLDQLRVKLPPGTSAHPSASGLVPAISGPYLPATGTTPTGRAVQLRVRAAGPDARGRQLYDVTVLAPDGVVEVDYCAGGAYAYAVPGSFNVKGVYGRFTDTVFACTVGGAAKAVLWDYTPDRAYGAYFQAAVRLARADFCASGLSNTFTGTPVLHSDPDGIYLLHPGPDHGDGASPGPFYFEAAWAAGSGPNAKSVQSDMFCVAKWRYQALRPSACTFVMPDPRGGDISLPFCEGYRKTGDSEEAWLARIAAAAAAQGRKVVFSFSTSNERGLWEHRRYGGSSEQYVASVHDYDGYGSDDGSPPEFPSVYVGSARFIGVVLVAARPGETRPLYLYNQAISTYNYRTTSDPDFRGAPCTGAFCGLLRYHKLRVIGHVFTSPAPGRVPLYTYKKGSQYRIFTFSPGDAPPAGWTYVGFEGYALRSARTDG